MKSDGLAVHLLPNEKEEHVATGQRFAIAAQGRDTAAAGAEIYEAGGNIIDAAVAVSFAISVERPQSTGIGGGGFLLFRNAQGEEFAVDFRERAPMKASAEMFLDDKKEPIPGKSLNGMLSVATPGLVAGLLDIHKKWGKLPLDKVMAPAIRIAEQGLVVTPHLATAIKNRADVLARDPAAKSIFLKADGSPFVAGEKIVQMDLARTLRRISHRGKDGFYRGPVARAILSASQTQGGILLARDLANYQVRWRLPLHGTFRGYELLSMPPPSSGGIHVLQILNMLENEPLKELGALSPEAIHLTASAQQSAFADRAVYPGDPDFVEVPTDLLISKSYAKKRRAEFSATARSSTTVRAGSLPKEESPETTHFSILDSEGNAVSSTQTINFSFGSGVVAPGTGVLLNDEMDDFSIKPGVANAYGAVGGNANSIAPGKTPLSSMSPTIVLKDGSPIMAVGAPGGTRIITCVADTILNSLAYEMPPYESVATARFHHQWMPDRLDIEVFGPLTSTLLKLEKMGYKVEAKADAIPCRVELVTKDKNGFTGVSDPRDSGRAVAK